MRNRDIIKQYVNSCFDLPENQYNKLTTSLKKTYKRTVLRAYNNEEKHLKKWQFQLFTKEEQIEMIRNWKRYFLLDIFNYEYFDDNFKCEYLLSAMIWYADVVINHHKKIPFFVVNTSIEKLLNPVQKIRYDELMNKIKKIHKNNVNREIVTLIYNWSSGDFDEVN